MARRKPAPPPSPSLPLFTIDTILNILLYPVLSPTASLLVPLVPLSLGHAYDSRPLLYTYAYTAVTLLLQLLAYIDDRLSRGRARTVQWEDEVILITGGAGGLGRCIAEVYGMRGVSVAVVDILPETAERQDEWEQLGCSYYRCDVGDATAVQALKNRIESDLGTPTILINNAAVVHGRPMLSLTSSDVETTYRVNVLSHFYTIQTLLPGMLAGPNGGTIATISSVLGNLGCASLADYTSSKAAVTALHHSLRAELQLMRTKSSSSPPINMILAAPGQLTTSLFSRITPPSTFLGPLVTPAQLAAEVVKAVDRGTDAEIALPLYARWIGWFNVLPGGLRAVVRDLVGLDRAAWDGMQQSREGLKKR